MKWFNLFLVILLLPGCSCFDSSGIPGKVSVRVGEVFSVPLGANSSTGFDWTVKNDPSMLEFLGYDSELPAGIPAPGYGSARTYRFKALKNGTTLLTLVCERSTEHGFAVNSVMRTIEILVTIQ